jgi:hypothetical protein
MHGLEVVDIAHAIQLAVAPVFLFSGVGVLLGVLTNRLARVVDRARKVEESLKVAAPAQVDDAREQLQVASRRARFINVSITLSTIAALLIALLFASTFVPLNLAAYVAVLFVLTMVALVCALISFLFEVRIAIAALKIGTR